MDNPYQKIVHYLQQKEIQLEDYQNFLKYETTSSFGRLNHFFKERSIDLNSYQHYLETLSDTSPLPDKNLLVAKNEVFSEGVKEVQFLGDYLLSSGKVQLDVFNKILRKQKKVAVRPILQELVKAREIKAEEFVTLDQKKWNTSLVDFPCYKLRAQENAFEFYLAKTTSEKKLGHYLLLEELGRGGMGIVYKAYHPLLNRIVALKVIRSGENATDTMKARFKREIETLVKLEHPGIVQILDSGYENNQDYFVMEYVDGTSFEQFIKKKISLNEKLTLLKKSLAALSYAHSKGIIHRDLKLENIFITQTNEPKIGDFGLAKNTLDSFSQKLTQSGIVLGTLIYMAPEQASGETTKVDERTDVYSMGVCCYFLLTGRFPFMAKSKQKLLEKIIHEEALSPLKLNPKLNKDLETMVLKALEKEPKKRYQTAEEFCLDLELFLAGHRIATSSASHWEQIKKWRKQHRFPLLFIFVFLLTITCFLAFFQWNTLQKEERRFDEALEKAQQARAEYKTLAHKKQDRFYHTKYLFYALNHLNSALFVKEANRAAEQNKWEVGQLLIQLAFQSQEFHLADYVSQELISLQSISSQKKEQLANKIKEEKNKNYLFHRHSFQNWMSKLKTSLLSEQEIKDAIFEISKMREKEIFADLLLSFEESSNYYLSQKTRQKKLEQYYSVVVILLGRLGDGRAANPLFKTLVGMSKMLSPIPSGKRKFYQIDYMVKLTEALGNLAVLKYTPPIDEIRWKMGARSSYWERTKIAYRKLVKKVKIGNEKLDSANAYLSRGTVYLSKEEYDKAIQDFDQAIQLNPKLLEAYHNRAYSKRAIGDIKGALADFNQAVLIAPSSAALFNSRGSLRRKNGDLAGALQDFNQAIKLDPTYESTYVNRGNIKRRMRRLKEAILDYNKALKINSKLVQAYNGKGIAKVDLGDYRGSINDFTAAIQIAPDYVDALNNRGNSYRQLGSYEKAIDDYNEAIRLSPKYSSAFYNRGIVKQMKKDFQGALQDYDEALRRNPKYIEVYMARANLKKRMGHKAGALQDYQLLLKENANNIEAYFILSKVEKEAGNYKGAIKAMKLAIQRFPRSFRAYNNRGQLYELSGNLFAALLDFNKALQIAPNYEISYSNRGRIKRQQNDFSGALSDFNKAIELRPTFALAYTERAVTKELMKDLKGALADFSKAIQLDPGYFQVYGSRGVIRFFRKDKEGAKKDFKIFLQLTEKVREPRVLKARRFILKEFPELAK